MQERVPHYTLLQMVFTNSEQERFTCPVFGYLYVIGGRWRRVLKKKTTLRAMRVLEKCYTIYIYISVFNLVVKKLLT